MPNLMSHVTQLAKAGCPLERIEAIIEATEGPSVEERALAWVLAWSGGTPAEVAELLGCPLRFN